MGADDQHEEVIMIAFDNARWMESLASTCFYEQLEAVRLYCHAKLQSNPKNAIGLFTMGGGRGSYSSYLKPTNDVDKIMTLLHRGIMYGGDLDFGSGIASSLAIVTQLMYQAKLKRVLICLGSPALLNFDVALQFGNTAKRLGVAVDVVNFRPKLKHELNGFVAAADNNGNSHIKHIPPGSSLRIIREALSSYRPIITRELMKQGEIAAIAAAREKNTIEKTAAAAAAREKKTIEKADQIRELELYLKGKNQAAVDYACVKARELELLNKFNALSRILDDER